MPRPKKNAGKPAKEKPPKTSESDFCKAAKDVIKQFGEDIVVKGNEIVEKPKKVVSVSPALDKALGGGFQSGSIVIMSGLERCGKSTTALQFAANWQKSGGHVVYIGAEHRLEKQDLLQIPDLDIPAIDVVRSKRGRILSAQDNLTIAEAYLSQETNVLLIIDSISILCENKELNSTVDDEFRGGAGKLMGTFCRRNAPVVAVNENILIGIAHLYANVTGRGKSKIESVATKLKYQLSTSMICDYVEAWNESDDEDSTRIGQKVHWLVQRTPLGPPYKKATSYLRYGYGLDTTMELMDNAAELALLQKNGSWLKLLLGDREISKQGQAKMLQHLKDNPDILQQLKDQIAEYSGGDVEEERELSTTRP